MTLSITMADLDDAQVRALLALHLAGMRENSPAEAVFALDLSGLQAPEISVWTAWWGDRLAAIGALKQHDAASGEIKSMRAHPDFLGTGAGRAILRHILAEARTRGLARLSLETGRGAAFEPALALYRAHGFVEGEAFADYRPNQFSQFYHLSL